MDATTFFLTYPQSSFEHGDLHSFLGSVKPVIWARICTESHADGGDHVHCIVRFGARVKTRSNHAIFDYMGRHPNIQVTRNIKNVLEYVAKDGSYTDYGTIPGTQGELDAVYQLAKGDDREAFDRAALGARMSYQWAVHIWNMGRGEDERIIRQASEGTMCMQLLCLRGAAKTTVLVGPTGCGKTTWALRECEKPALWVTHKDDLRLLNKSIKCIIFDDMDFEHWPITAQIHIVDQDMTRSIDVKHGKAVIPKGIQKIFTCNKYPFTEHEAIKRRVKLVEIISLVI